MIQMQHIATSHATIAVHILGAGAPLFLIHGFPLDASLWFDVAPALAQSGRQIIMPDLQGFGQSSPLDGCDPTLTIEQLAEDIEQVRQVVCPDRSIELCGLSLGGYVALEYWRLFRSHLAALVLTNTKPHSDSPDARAGRLKMADKAIATSTWEAVSPMLEKLISAQTISRQPEVKNRIEAMMSSVPQQTIYAIQHAMAGRRDFTTELPKIDIPTLIITGELDPISPPSENRTWSQALPKAYLKIIAGAAHLPPVETPEAFVQAIEQWNAMRM